MRGLCTERDRLPRVYVYYTCGGGSCYGNSNGKLVPDVISRGTGTHSDPWWLSSQHLFFFRPIYPSPPPTYIPALHILPTYPPPPLPPACLPAILACLPACLPAGLPTYSNP